MFTCDKLATIPHIRHGFFGRKGGVSEGLYASRNCGYGSGDDVEKVRENRARVSRDLGSQAELLTCFQIHSAKVITVKTRWEWKDSPEADAMVTMVPNIPLGVLAADCQPILFADVRRPIIGAAHAGWKGAVGGVVEATLDAMKALGAREIVATIGPTISQASYEVGEEFRARFLAESVENLAFFVPSPRPDHYMFDLNGYTLGRLKRAGVAQTHVLGYDTLSLEEDFFSYRRSCLRGEPVYGRQVSAIMITK